MEEVYSLDLPRHREAYDPVTRAELVEMRRRLPGGDFWFAEPIRCIDAGMDVRMRITDDGLPEFSMLGASVRGKLSFWCRDLEKWVRVALDAVHLRSAYTLEWDACPDPATLHLGGEHSISIVEAEMMEETFTGQVGPYPAWSVRIWHYTSASRMNPEEWHDEEIARVRSPYEAAKIAVLRLLANVIQWKIDAEANR